MYQSTKACKGHRVDMKKLLLASAFVVSLASSVFALEEGDPPLQIEGLVEVQRAFLKQGWSVHQMFHKQTLDFAFCGANKNFPELTTNKGRTFPLSFSLMAAKGSFTLSVAGDNVFVNNNTGTDVAIMRVDNNSSFYFDAKINEDKDVALMELYHSSKEGERIFSLIADQLAEGKYLHILFTETKFEARISLVGSNEAMGHLTDCLKAGLTEEAPAQDSPPKNKKREYPAGKPPPKLIY